MPDNHPANVWSDWPQCPPAVAHMLRTIPALEADIASRTDLLAIAVGEIGVLETERDALRAEVTRWSTTAAVIEADRNELRAEVEALREDAGRYRALRDAPIDVDEGLIDVCIWENDVGQTLRGRQLDADIDAARKQQ